MKLAREDAIIEVQRFIALGVEPQGLDGRTVSGVSLTGLRRTASAIVDLLAPRGGLPTEEATLAYIRVFESGCRACADHDGVCPVQGLPCDLDEALPALRHATRAILYGLEHNFLGASEEPPEPVEEPDSAPLDLSKLSTMILRLREAVGVDFDAPPSSLSVNDIYGRSPARTLMRLEIAREVDRLTGALR
jgi:hypothetical protein